MRLFDGSGRPLAMDKKLASGGEGTVFTLSGDKESLVKVYDAPPSTDRIDKLKAMVAHAEPSLLEYCAWPLDLVLDAPKGRVCGFSMRWVKDHWPIHDLYSPKYRAVHFEKAHWGFLVLAAENMCRAFGAIHARGHVIGDVNNSSVLMSEKATAVLIDCDSFQTRFGSRVYRCEVGVPGYTPPELQGCSFESTPRSVNHDLFGLSVLVFQLLFMSRHPFSGELLDGSEMDLVQKIRENRFAFGPGVAQRGIRQPPNTAPLSITGNSVSRLFERAFSRDSCAGGRPSADEWVTALSQLRQQLVRCLRHPMHYHMAGLTSCPWCDIESATSAVMFVVPLQGAVNLTISINLETCWSAVLKVPKVGPDPIIRAGKQRPKDRRAVRVGLLRKLRVIGAVLALGGTVLTLSLLGLISGGAPLGLGVVAFVLVCVIAGEKNPKLAGEFRGELQAAERRLSEIRDSWQARATQTSFERKLQELKKYRKELPSLAEERQRRMGELRATIRERQLARYLQQFRIDQGGVPGIGPGRSSNLEAYGIETAADIELNKCLSVYGIGWTYANNLVSWRRAKEARFVFQPAKGIDPVDVRELDTELQQRKDRAELELRNGAATLAALNVSIEAARRELVPLLEAATVRVEEMRANLRAL